MFSFFHSKPSVFFLFYHILFCLSNRVWGHRERDELKAKLSAVSSELATYKKKEEDARYFSREKMKKEATRISREDELSRELKKAKAFISACGLSADYQQFRYNSTTRKNVLE